MKKSTYIALLLSIAGIFVACNIYTFIPIYHQVSTSLIVSEAQAVTAGSIFTFFYAIGLLCYGASSNLMERKFVLVQGMLCASIATFWVGITNNINALYIARALQGFSLASFAHMAFAYAFDLFVGSKRTLLLVLINTAYLVAGIFGLITSAFISEIFGWRYVFIFYSGTYLVLFLLVHLALPIAPKQVGLKVPYLTSFKHLLKS